MGNLNESKSIQMQIRISHHFLKNPFIVNEQNQELIKICCGADELEYQEWQQSLSRYKNRLSKYIFLPIKSNFSKNGICSSIGNAEIYYEKFCYLISEQIYHRSGRKAQFYQNQMWLLILRLTKAKRQAFLAGDELGDIRPNNIFLNELGMMKIACQSSWPNATTSFQKGLEKQIAYISPQDINNLAKGYVQSANKQASQIFSIGLTLLSFTNLNDYESLYDVKERKFNYEDFNQAIIKLRKNQIYSQVLKSLILNLCSLDIDKRMNLQQLQNLLLKHENIILDKRRFVIDNAPIKLHQQIQQFHQFKKNNPFLFASSHILSQGGGSGLIFPEHLEVKKITPSYGFDSNTPTIIKQLQ